MQLTIIFHAAIIYALSNHSPRYAENKMQYIHNPSQIFLLSWNTLLVVAAGSPSENRSRAVGLVSNLVPVTESNHSYLLPSRTQW